MTVRIKLQLVVIADDEEVCVDDVVVRRVQRLITSPSMLEWKISTCTPRAAA